MSITTIDLLNARVDLSDALSWRAAQTPRFIRLFNMPRSAGSDELGRPIARCATNPEHCWLEGVETPKTKSFTSYEYEAAPERLPSPIRPAGKSETCSISWAIRPCCA
ncbi:MAG: hypothetical protein IK077_06760 [Thermoguttaceae bacterium]|nr:hypothetical protein [Thermoguttaceae bacterium]